jgi:hypothetical protein
MGVPQNVQAPAKVPRVKEVGKHCLRPYTYMYLKYMILYTRQAAAMMQRNYL